MCCPVTVITQTPSTCLWRCSLWHTSGCCSLCYKITEVSYTVFFCVVRSFRVSLTTGSPIMISTEKVSPLTPITNASPSVSALRPGGEQISLEPSCFLCFTCFLRCVCCSVLIQLIGEDSCHFMQENLHMIKTPALVVWGKEDQVLMSNSDTVLVVKGRGHNHTVKQISFLASWFGQQVILDH